MERRQIFTAIFVAFFGFGGAAVIASITASFEKFHTILLPSGSTLVVIAIIGFVVLLSTSPKKERGLLYRGTGLLVEEGKGTKVDGANISGSFENGVHVKGGEGTVVSNVTVTGADTGFRAE